MWWRNEWISHIISYTIWISIVYKAPELRVSKTIDRFFYYTKTYTTIGATAHAGSNSTTMSQIVRTSLEFFQNLHAEQLSVGMRMERNDQRVQLYDVDNAQWVFSLFINELPQFFLIETVFYIFPALNLLHCRNQGNQIMCTKKIGMLFSCIT